MPPQAWNPSLPIRQIVTWWRPGGVNFAPTHYLPSFEWIIIYAKPAFRLADKGWNATDVWQMTPERDIDHPAPFPLLLPKRVLTTTGATSVLDPHMGSGTTLRAAKDLGISAIGIEISERYCEIAAKRLSQGVLFGSDVA
jgi:DNA modification methylase